MKIMLPLIAALALLLPVGTQAGPGHHTNHHSGYFQDGGRHDHHHFAGFHGDRGHFRGWNGTFIGEIIILDDGCYFWNGYEWLVYIDCD
jgi:hypothetical protein